MEICDLSIKYLQNRWYFVYLPTPSFSTNVNTNSQKEWLHAHYACRAGICAVLLKCLLRKYDHITATLRGDLHWLPIHERITYKPCIIVYKCLHGAAPSYLTEMCVPVAASTVCHCLRSAAHGNLMVPRMRMITYGSRSFAVSGPGVWNDLPPTLRSSSTTPGQFQSRLKTILFHFANRMWLWSFCDCLGRYNSAFAL